jgi:GAF domain-containing protein
LRRRVEDERFAADLRSALVLAAAAGTIGSPLSHARLLELIVETAADVIDARAAHLFLVDEDADELVFVVAVGPHQAEVEQRRVPLAHGLAGLAVVGGQPVSVADAREDPRLASEVAQFLGYVPDSILCVPLFLDDKVIGVIELLDKEGEAPFGAADIAHLGRFANLSAVAIAQSRVHGNWAGMIGEVLDALGDEATAGVRQRAAIFAANAEEADDVNYREALELARLVQEIAWHGEAEHRACLTLLQGFADYLRSRPRFIAGQGGQR